MLPPVSAVSSADFSFSATTPRQEPQVAASVLPAVEQVTQETSISSPTVTARAMSGELQLQQNGTILSETLGTLLNIARMDGETADAYASRLVTAVQALPADQLASLEKQLATLLKGMTVSILLETLQNTSGPTAARLAALFEIARTHQTGEGSKIALPSYLQDIVPDGPVISLRPGGPQHVAPATVSPTTGTAAPGQQPQLLQNASVASPVALPAEAVDSVVEKRVLQQQPSATLSIVAVGGGVSGKPSSMPVASPADLLPEKNAAVAANVQQNQTAPRAAQASPTLPLTTTAHLAKPVAVSQNIPLVVVEPELPDVNLRARQTVEATVPVPMSTLPSLARQFAAASPQDMEKLLVAVLLGKIPPDVELDGLEPLSYFPTATVEAEHEPKHRAAQIMSPPQSNSAQSDDAETASALRQDMQISARAAMVADGKAAILDQPLLQSAVAAMVTKEGTPLPFVQYPIERDDDSSDAPPRGRWPSSESEAEADGEEAPPEGQHGEEGAEGEERIAANDEAVDHSVSDGAHQDGRVGEAESYYLRMSNFA